jgi:hypothetical protein
MIDISDFPNHLNTISIYDWQKLFALNSELQKTESFGKLEPSESVAESNLQKADWCMLS